METKKKGEANKMEKKYTRLDENELNKVTGGADVPGNFSWDKEPEGITVNPSEEMDGIFTPKDTKNYDWN